MDQAAGWNRDCRLGCQARNECEPTGRVFQAHRLVFSHPGPAPLHRTPWILAPSGPQRGAFCRCQEQCDLGPVPRTPSLSFGDGPGVRSSPRAPLTLAGAPPPSRSWTLQTFKEHLLTPALSAKLQGGRTQRSPASLRCGPALLSPTAPPPSPRSPPPGPENTQDFSESPPVHPQPWPLPAPGPPPPPSAIPMPLVSIACPRGRTGKGFHGFDTAHLLQKGTQTVRSRCQSPGP